MKNFNPVRGTYDYTLTDAKFREQVRQIILKNYQQNGYNLVETPILENLDFLNSSDGGDNLQLIFKTIKRGDKLTSALTKQNLQENDLTEEGLRYDLTVPLARYYCNNKDKLPTPFKSIQIGYSFRAERPQRGRNRQFIQCDIDVFGEKSLNAELELLDTVLKTYNNLGFGDLTLRINDRRILTAVVLNAGFKSEDVNTVCVTLDKLDKISISGVVMELIEKGFESENINKLADSIADIQKQGLQSTIQYGATGDIVSGLEGLIGNVKKLNPKAKVVYDISIVRGQGYYTGTIYEVFAEGFTGALGGGGRYDNMLQKFSGTSCPAVGFGAGFEPIVMLLKERGAQFEAKPNLALLYNETDDILDVFKKKEKLKQKYNVGLYLKPKNMRAFYEKIVAVADFVAQTDDITNIKKLEK